MDIYQIPKLRTGIRELDRLLYGGLPFGGVVLVSGNFICVLTAPVILFPDMPHLAFQTGRQLLKEYQITVQTDQPNILVFPFLDASGRMTFVKYRKTDYDREKAKNKEWCENE